MSWSALFAGLLKLVAALAAWFQQRQLLQAGEARALAEGLAATVSAIEEARHARAGLDDTAERDRLRGRFTRPDDRSGNQ